MRSSCLYLILDDQGISASLTMDNDQGSSWTQGSCRALWLESSRVDPVCAKSMENQQDQEISLDSQEPFALAMNQVAGELNLSSCSCAMVFFPSHWASFRTLCLPFSSSRKIRQILDFELEGYLPVEESHVSDFYSIGRAGEKFQVVTSSIANSHLESCVNTLKSFGIRVNRAAPYGCAVAQGFLDAYKDQDHGVLIIREGQRLVFVLILQGHVCSLRSRPDMGNPGLDMIRARVVEILAGACQEFGMNMDLPVFLCLEDDNDSGLARNLASVLAEIPGVAQVSFCPGWNTWPMALDADTSYPRMLQFIKPGHRAGAIFEKYGLGFGICGFLAAAILGISLLGVVAKNISYTRAIEGLDAQASTMFLETFPGTIRIQDPYMQMKANVEAAVKKSGTRFLDGPSAKVAQILNELSVKIDPDMDVVITRFLLREGRLILAGTTNDFNNVDKIKTLVTSSALFQKVEITSASADKEANRVHFRCVIEL